MCLNRQPQPQIHCAVTKSSPEQLASPKDQLSGLVKAQNDKHVEKPTTKNHSALTRMIVADQWD
jgi:hypothetical protein